MTAAAIARRFEITGWVRNELDGSVLLEAQGQPREVQSYLDSLATQMGGFITNRTESPVAEVPGEAGFRIER